MKFSLEHGMSIRRCGSGPPLVWIHGLGESSTSFDPVVARLPQFSHVLLDLPGYGRSPWPDDAADTALYATADHVAGWLRTQPAAVVIGHSMGGVLATMLAERGVVRGIIDVDGNLSRGDCTFSLQATAYCDEDFASYGFAELRGRIFSDGVVKAPLRGYHAAMCFASPRVFHRQAADLVALSSGGTLAPRLAALSVPALYVAGVPDGICAASRALLDQHGIRWVGVEPAGHWVYLDQLDRFAELVTRFG